MEFNKATFFVWCGGAGAWLVSKLKYIVPILILIFIGLAAKYWIIPRLHNQGPAVLTNGTGVPADLSSDANYIICIFDQKECVYKNAGIGIKSLILKCGALNKCDVQGDQK